MSGDVVKIAEQYIEYLYAIVTGDDVAIPEDEYVDEEELILCECPLYYGNYALLVYRLHEHDVIFKIPLETPEKIEMYIVIDGRITEVPIDKLSKRHRAMLYEMDEIYSDRYYEYTEIPSFTM